MRQQRIDLLRLGAAGRLLLAGEVETVMPLEDAALHEAANPVGDESAVVIDAAAMEAREDAHVRSAIAAGPCAVIVLGAAHDLSDNVRRIALETCEYVRVATKQQAALAADR